jgi:type II secretory pathway component GspD/PulD (secretin)
MRGFLSILIFLFFVSSAHAEETPYKIDVRGVTVAALSELVFHDIKAAPYVLDPAVVADTRVVSAKLEGDNKEFYNSFVAYLKTLGFSSTLRDGVFFVAPTPEYAPPTLSREVFVYTPRYRSVSYLVSVLQGLVSGKFSSSAGGQSSGSDAPRQVEATSSTSALSFVDQKPTQLVFLGTAEEKARIKSILPKIDIAEGDVVISAAVYQVQSGHSDGSAVSLAFKVLGTGLSAALAPSLAAVTSSFSLSSVNIDAVVKILNSDTRFHEISTPYVRTRSGTKATFNSGAQVPVLAASTTSTSGSVTQSVSYKDSGVIFTVTPTLRGEIVDVEVTQELSSFTSTTTGVNDTPTLNRRSLTSSLSLAGGDTIIIGGLTVDQSSASVDGVPFLPSFMDRETNDNSRSEILLVLHVDRVDGEE